jgi:uncharacterized membrane protein
MVIIVGIFAALVIVALAVLAFLSSGTWSRGETLQEEKGSSPRKPRDEKLHARGEGIN